MYFLSVTKLTHFCIWRGMFNPKVTSVKKRSVLICFDETNVILLHKIVKRRSTPRVTDDWFEMDNREE